MSANRHWTAFHHYTSSMWAADRLCSFPVADGGRFIGNIGWMIRVVFECAISRFSSAEALTVGYTTNYHQVKKQVKSCHIQNLENHLTWEKITANALGLPLHTWVQHGYHYSSYDRYLGGSKKELPKFSRITNHCISVGTHNRHLSDPLLHNQFSHSLSSWMDRFSMSYLSL